MKINPISSHKIYTPNFERKSRQKQPKCEIAMNIGLNEMQIYLISGDCSFSDMKNIAKTNLWLCSNPLTKRTMKAMVHDPKAYFFELKRLSCGQLLSDEVIGTVPVKNRKTKQEEKLDIQRVRFADETTIYALNKGKERLGFVDIDTIDIEDDIINVGYISTVVGREDYRGLFLTLMQVVVEDSINNGIIPTIQATPVAIGKNSFDRKFLYEFYGAETKVVDGEYGHEVMSVVPRNRVINMLDGVKKSPKRNFIFESTEENFDKLKNGV